jgi:DHA1 family bicyclomycin/chloramphenicol resistance-like MFS transporter
VSEAAPGAIEARPAGRASLGFMLLLVGLTALAPFSLQIFLPALPVIQAEFRVTPGTAQLVLSLSILASAFAMLAYGPLSDRFGRRPVLLAGLIAFLAGSVISALAPSISALIGGRVVQAIGAAAGMVLARAIVRDLHDRERSASVIAYLTTAMVVAPMLAPTVGAVLVDLASWRTIFGLTAVVGLAVTWQTSRRLVETRPGGAGGDGPLRMWAGAGRLLRTPGFLAYALQSTFAIAVFFAFISGAPYFMLDVLHRPATEYGLYFILVSAGFMAGNLLAARVTARVGLDRMILIGSTLALGGTLLALVLLAAWRWAPIALFGPMLAAAFANGLTVPNAQAGAISVEPALAGTASGLAGFLQMFTAALVSQAVGALQNGTPYPMVGFMTICALLSLLSFVLPRRRATMA